MKITSAEQLVRLMKELHICKDLDEAMVYLGNGELVRVIYFGELSIGNIFIEVECADGSDRSIKLADIDRMIITRDNSTCSTMGSTYDTEVVVAR